MTIFTNKGNSYKKLSNGWGAFVDTGYGGSSIEKPVTGDVVVLYTRAGEKHERVVDKIIKDYASGCIVSFKPDEDIAKKANDRYQAKVVENTKTTSSKNYNRVNQLCPKCHTYCYGDCEAN